MKKSIPGFMLIALLAGCIPSVHPLVTPEMAVSMDEIVGLYLEDEEDGDYIEFKKELSGPKNTYTMYTGEKADELEALYTVRFAWFNKRLFANFYPVNAEKGDCGSPDFVAMNTFARVELKENKLVMEYSDMDELKKMFQEGKVRLKHEVYGKNGEILITASTQQLEKFVKQHGGNDVFFSIESILIPVEKQIRPGR